MLYESRVFVVALYKYCVLEDGKCLLPFPTLNLSHSFTYSHSFLTGMEMGFHIMGNSENIGSNIIFPSTFYSMSWKKKKKLPSALKLRDRAVGGVGGKAQLTAKMWWNGEIIRCSFSRAERGGGVKPEARTSTVYQRRKKNCLLGNSVIHIIPFRFYILFCWDL